MGSTAHPGSQGRGHLQQQREPRCADCHRVSSRRASSFARSLDPLADQPVQAFDFYLDSTATTEERVVALSRALVNAVIVRGAHLAIVKSLPTEDHVQIHLDGSAYIVKKLKAYDEAKRKEARNKAVAYFKALGNLVIGIDGKGALKMCVVLRLLPFEL